MKATSVDVINWGGQRARLAPWRGDPGVAHLTPLPGSGSLTSSFVRQCLDKATVSGYTRVVTSALTASEQHGFRATGFTVAEELHLLAHDLECLPPSRPVEVRRARRDDRQAVLELDAVAFPPFWRLDRSGLEEALAATPAVRFRVAGEAHVSGYAITGRAGRRGYLQRLAVHPDARRLGSGTALVVDGLRWLRRWRAGRALVNTQLENEAALALYESLGFRREPSGLSVLGVDLPS